MNSTTLTWSPYRDAVVALSCPDRVVRLINGALFVSKVEWLARAANEARARKEA
jgi:hypothetical protein